MEEQRFVQEMKTKSFLIIYGAGMVGKLVYSRLCFQGLKNRVIGFAVSEKTEAFYLGTPVYEIGELHSYKNEACVIIATLPVLHKEILENLYFYGFTDIWKISEELFEDMSTLYGRQFRKEHMLNKKEIDILFMASDNSSSSGAFLCMVDLNVELNRKGISTAVILPEYGNGEEVLQKNHIDFTYIPSRHWGKETNRERPDFETIMEKENKNAIQELEEFIAGHRVKLVHNNTTYTYVGAIAAKNTKIPWVWHIRENISEQGYAFIHYDDAIKRINQSAKIIVVSQYIKSCYKDFDESKERIIYDGVKIDDYYYPKNDLLERKKIVLAVIGVLTELKGQKDIIEAARILKNNKLDFQVLLVGGGDKDYIEYLHMLVRKYQLEEEIIFCGKQDNIPDFYQKTDIVVVCSKAEAFGRVTVEAQLSGCLVIGAKAGATMELLEDKKTGFLYERGNGRELAEKIAEAVRDRGQSRKIAACGQSYARQAYSKEQNAKEIIKIYNEIFSENRNFIKEER